MKKTAYIAGPVKDKEQRIVEALFGLKEAELTKVGYNVINPVAAIAGKNKTLKTLGEAPLTDEHNRREILAECLYNLVKYADEVHMLPGWQESEGASLERDIAIRLGIPVIYHKY